MLGVRKGGVLELKIECYADEKDILELAFELSGICVFSSCDLRFCQRGEEGCKECIENRIEWNVIKEGEKA